MPSIQIKDVPDDVHATLRQRAAAAGQSLQEYLLGRLVAEASTPTLDEVLARAGGRAGGRAGLAAATKAVRAQPRPPVIVIDASILVTGLADDGDDGDRVRRRLHGERLAAPHMIDVEVVSAWRRLSAAGALDERRTRLALADLAAMPLDRVAHGPLLERAWQLRANLTIHDAVYVALAEALDTVLLTADRRLAEAPGTRCAIELVAS